MAPKRKLKTKQSSIKRQKVAELPEMANPNEENRLMPKIGRSWKVYPQGMSTRRQAKILQSATPEEVKALPFLELPSEIRNEIYQLVLPFPGDRHIKSGISSVASNPLIDVNQQIRGEFLSLFFHTRAFHYVIKNPEQLHNTVKDVHDLNKVFPDHLRVLKVDILDYLSVIFSTSSRVPSELTYSPVEAAENKRAAYTTLTYLDDYESIECSWNKSSNFLGIRASILATSLASFVWYSETPLGEA